MFEPTQWHLSSELELTVADETRSLSAGDFGHVPPGTLHSYANRSGRPVKFLAWTVGGPIDEFFLAMSEQVRQMPQDAPVMARLMERFGVEMSSATH